MHQEGEKFKLFQQGVVLQARFYQGTLQGGFSWGTETGCSKSSSTNQKDILKKVLDNIDYFSTICNLIQKDYINVKLKAYRSFQKHEINRAIRAIAQIPGAIILKNEEKKNSYLLLCIHLGVHSSGVY